MDAADDALEGIAATGRANVMVKVWANKLTKKKNRTTAGKFWIRGELPHTQIFPHFSYNLKIRIRRHNTMMSHLDKGINTALSLRRHKKHTYLEFDGPRAWVMKNWMVPESPFPRTGIAFTFDSRRGVFFLLFEALPSTLKDDAFKPIRTLLVGFKVLCYICAWFSLTFLSS